MRICHTVAVAVAFLWLIPLAAISQNLPRTNDNQPDLQGIWTNATLTPLERPLELAGKAFFTPDEAAAFEKQMRERNNGDRRDANAAADLAVGLDAETLLYQFTIDDPESFAKPWSGEIPMKKTEGPILEYACHEGNYSMLHTLGAAREEEKKTGR